MQKRIWLIMLFATLVIAGTANAQVTQIVLGNGNNANNVVFTGTSTGATISFLGTCGATSNCMSGTAVFEPAGGGATVGSFAMWITGSNSDANRHHHRPVQLPGIHDRQHDQFSVLDERRSRHAAGYTVVRHHRQCRTANPKLERNVHHGEHDRHHAGQHMD